MIDDGRGTLKEEEACLLFPAVAGWVWVWGHVETLCPSHRPRTQGSSDLAASFREKSAHSPLSTETPTPKAFCWHICEKASDQLTCPKASSPCLCSWRPLPTPALWFPLQAQAQADLWPGRVTLTCWSILQAFCISCMQPTCCLEGSHPLCPIIVHSSHQLPIIFSLPALLRVGCLWLVQGV